MPTYSPNHRDVAQRPSSRSESGPDPMVEGSSTASGRASQSSRRANGDGNGTESSTDPRRSSTEKARRRLFRHSGGFLLDPTGHSRQANGALKRSTQRNFQSGEAKQKSRIRDHVTAQPRSVSDGFNVHGLRVQSGSPKERDTSYSGDSSTLNGTATTEDLSRKRRSPAPSTLQRNGSSHTPLDSESADIVNLALSLNENRRRWLQTSTTNDASILHPKQRTSSALFGQPHLAAELDHLSASRHASATYGASSGNGTPLRTVVSPMEIANRLSDGMDSNSHQGGLDERMHPDFRPSALTNSSIIPSEATMQRVHKAKAALELAYQHRRLLQYLTDLPSSSSSLKRPTTGKNEATQQNDSGTSGRRYNPLQYVRNRRLRFREGCPLNPEAAGWNDIEKVENWISRVVEQRSRLNSAESKPRLPPFPNPGASTDIDLDNTSPGSASDKLPATGSKPTRPRSDWETNPWSMLADVYWTAKEEHQGMLEDRHGSKLYPRAARGKPQVSQRLSLDMVPRSSQPASTRPEVPTDVIHNRDVSVPEPGHERGRDAHRTRETNNRPDHCSSSSDRRTKWPRKILRSESASSSEEDSRREPRNTALHRRMDSKSIQERALFERQLRELQAQETGDDQGRQSLDLETSSHRKYSLAPSPERKTRERALSAHRHLSRSRKAQTWSVKSTHHSGKDDAYPESFDSTAPNSPEHRQSVPNITINLTPPHRDKTGSSKPRSFPQRSILAEVEKGLHKMHLVDPPVPHLTPRDESKPDVNRGSLPDVKEVDETISPAHSPRNESQRHTKPSENSSRTLESKETDSRFRGLVRSARIAELVASPVTRVADLIWRREETEAGKNSSSSHDSLPMPAETSGDHGGTHGDDYKSDSDISIESVATAPGFHISNLPVFKSPFTDNRPTTPVTRHDNLRIDPHGHSDGQLGNARSDALSPRNLRTQFSSHSPVQSAEQDGSSDSKERQNSSGRRLAIADPFIDQTIQGSLSPTSAQPGSPGRGHGHRRWASLDSHHGFETLDLPSTSLKVTLDQVARLKVVQLSCTIRASELARKASRISSTTSKETATLQESTGIARPELPEVEQQLYTGGLMAKAIELQLEQTKSAATQFSSETVTGLHERLNSLHGQISEDLTQMARSAENGADELSAQLATDCTLDIKRLNETLDLIMRRRRRRMRWVRRAGFAALEWIVLITLWFLWLIVVFIRVVRGTVRIVVKTTKWVLWL